MKTQMSLKDRTAVVTGAASGIGRGLAQALARRHCHLALVDVNEAGLEQTAGIVSAPGLRVSSHLLDVANPDAVARFPGAVRSNHPGVDLLFNNAGVALSGSFEQVSEADFDWLFEINFSGMVRMTRAFLPLLKDSNDARLVYTSSVFGLIGPPGQAAYVASKFAIRGFAETLRHELEGTSIGISVVHPGGVATTIGDNARSSIHQSAEEIEQGKAAWKKMLVMPPQTAGEIIVRGVEQRNARILVGKDAKLIDLVARLAPAKYWKILMKLFPA
jgi:NAD(P)-dependent dehydrogenase (short-subunit alcohol dehydrogenase family)